MEVSDPISSILSSKKANAIWHISPDATVFEAIQQMAEKNVGALLVLDGERLVGIVSERDYTRDVILKDRASKETAVREIMTTDVICVKEDVTIEICLRLMTEKRIRHLPIVHSDGVRGVVSIGDLVRYVIAQQKAMIEQLEGYISGGYPG